MLAGMKKEDKVAWFIETTLYGALFLVFVYLLSAWFYYGPSLGPYR